MVKIVMVAIINSTDAIFEINKSNFGFLSEADPLAVLSIMFFSSLFI
jgi:hypothetical protein